jgi:hypothetical protein
MRGKHLSIMVEKIWLYLPENIDSYFSFYFYKKGVSKRFEIIILSLIVTLEVKASNQFFELVQISCKIPFLRILHKKHKLQKYLMLRFKYFLSHTVSL